MTQVITATHPLVDRALVELRDETTDTETFRRALTRAGALLTIEATRDLPTESITVTTPLGAASGRRAATPILVSILRAGNGLLDGALTQVPDAPVGHIGLARDPATLEAHEYVVRLPDLRGETVLVLDPMLATGHTSCAALDRVAAHDPGRVLLVCLVAAPEGLAELSAHHPAVDVVTAAVDERLDERGYIVPGLGDAGDRLYGT